MEYADSTTRPGQLPDETFDGFVAVSKPVFLDQILPDALNRQTGVQLGDNRIAITGCRRSRRQIGAGERFGRFWIRAGGHFGRFWRVGSLKLVVLIDSELLGAAEHFGRFCLPKAIVSGNGLAPDSGLSLDAPVRPTEFKKS